MEQQIGVRQGAKQISPQPAHTHRPMGMRAVASPVVRGHECFKNRKPCRCMCSTSRPLLSCSIFGTLLQKNSKKETLTATPTAVRAEAGPGLIDKDVLLRGEEKGGTGST